MGLHVSLCSAADGGEREKGGVNGDRKEESWPGQNCGNMLGQTH